MIPRDKERAAYYECRESWGGATMRQGTGEFYPDGKDAYAVTTGDTFSINENSSLAAFMRAVDKVAEDYPDATYIGVFHDDVKHTIDVNPVEVLNSRDEVDAFAETHTITGGAYHFATGDGYWPQGRPAEYK